MSAFDLAIRQISTARLRRLAVRFHKNANHVITRQDYVDLMSTLTQAQQFEAMREEILAGRGSMSLYSMSDGNAEPFAPNFQEIVGVIPTIVNSGQVGDIVEGLQHVQWAMTDGQTTYLDVRLQLRVEPEAIVVDSFYDPVSNVLQIRSNFSLSRKIAREWARMNNKVLDEQVRARGLQNLPQVHDFCDTLHGQIRKCTGDRLESQGFSRVSGLRAPGYDDLRGTPDYEEFITAVSMIESQVELEFEGEMTVVGIGLQTQSVVFMTSANEPVIGHVYSRLKSFLNL